MTSTSTRDAAESYRATVRRLAGAQKAAAPGAPAYSIYVNRPFGRLLAAACYRAGLTPDAVTGISAAFTFAAILVLATVDPAWWTGLVVGAGLVIGYAFDSADGQVARLRGGGSLAGEWLDHVVDAIKTSSLHLAVLISVYRFVDLPSDALLLVPLLYTVVAAVAFFAMILNDQLKAVHAKAAGARVARGGSTVVRSLLVLPTDYGLLCVVFLLLGAPAVFLTVYSLLFLANAAHLALALVKWFGDMRALDRQAAGASS
jgi:phosphatidylglycerophosphate synthase